MANSVRSRSEVLEVLRAHESELRVRGIEGLTLFGSMARDDVRSASDVDLAMRPAASTISASWTRYAST
jgi:predicted nucleotidyltransferase